MPDSRFWSGRRVFLTGHTGFKGAWLSLWLEQMGAKVGGFALPPVTNPNLFDLARPALNSFFGDIRDQSALAQAISSVRPEIAIHMAAQSLVRLSYSAPVETIGVNVLGTACVLEELRQAPSLQAILVVTSDKVYAAAHDAPKRELDSLGGRDPYSASKAAAEIICAGFRESFFPHIPVLTARAGNVIGGGDWAADRLIPDAWRADAANIPLGLRNPSATRPWQHVLDALAGYLRYIEAAAHGAQVPESLNFGPLDGPDLTVADVTELFLRGIGSKTRWDAVESDGRPEAASLKLDSCLAVKQLDWRPRLSQRESIDWSSGWYRAIARGGNPRDVCLDQIARYQLMT